MTISAKTRIACLLCAALLTACGRDTPDGGAETVDGKVPAAGVSAVAAPVAAAARPMPQKLFGPSPADVGSAFEAALIKTVMAAPETPQRDAWLNNEYARLKTLRVGACGQAPLGQRVACQIQFNGKNMVAELMLTDQGWLLFGLK